MADGSHQTALHLPMLGTSRLRPGEIVVDLFAGGGGASEALRQALGRDPDIAINHDANAIGMHAANHPYTTHHCEDVWHADPVAEVAGRCVGWLHAPPDCTHFSQAKGGQPRDRATRSLSWVVLKWAGMLRRAGVAPRIISLENVRQILQWGPLVAKRDPATGRVLRRTADGWAVAAPGERVALRDQWLIPEKRHAGRTWRAFVAALRGMGYAVEWRRLVASDYGAGTSRERLFLVARRDGAPIVWPAPTHGYGPGYKSKPVSASDCIDWSLPCRSIFDRPRPLADKTLRRIARGVHRFVLTAAEPFIVQTAYGEGSGATARRGSGAHAIAEPLGTVSASSIGFALVGAHIIQCANASANGVADAADPLGTVTAWPRGGAHAVVAPHLVKMRGDSGGADVSEPMPTITSGAGAARPAGAAHAMGVVSAHLCAMAQNVVGIDATDPLPTVLAGATRFGVTTAFLEQANGGNYTGPGADLRKPQPTICAQGGLQRLVTAHMATLRQHSTGADAREPIATISAGGEHHAAVQCTLSPDLEAGALRVAAFLMRYYGEGGQHNDARSPLATITTKDRLALVTVTIQGVPYVIVDIGLRMLEPHELYRAQGFPPGYIIDRTADGRRLPKWAQVQMVGNSVSPPPLRAIAHANLQSHAQHA